MSEFIRVNYATDRRAFVNGEELGRTNEILESGSGPFRVDLGVPTTYDPSFRRVSPSGTTADAPLDVDFTPKSDKT
ncbi:MAG: hypothetical protein M3Y64_08225 [Gemmatimonadota bacterium]|nr:hypothetical protein [Gemmatimonadota bacterium]